ncbi:MAG: hypothetical protein Q4D38_15035 [Planctomycetia bacterium]|nr:hypothetical protein [Planctomycetia bacterium]
MNPRLRFDFGLSFSPHFYGTKNEYVLIPDTHDWDGDDYDVTVSRKSTDYDFTPLFYPHRAANGNVILLLRAGTDMRRFGGVTLEEPSTYENTIPEEFHVFNLGALSENPTFTLGNEAAFPSFQTVAENHPKHTAGAAFFYYFLVDYGCEGGFLFPPFRTYNFILFEFIFLFFTQMHRFPITIFSVFGVMYHRIGEQNDLKQTHKNKEKKR